MNNKHFILTNRTIIHRGVKLYRIQATRDTLYINKGNLGGYVQSMDNLQDDAWVSYYARVYGNAQVYEHAFVYNTSEIYGNAHVYGYAQVFGSAEVFGNARVYGEARIGGHVYKNAQISGKSIIPINHIVFGDAHDFKII